MRMAGAINEARCAGTSQMLSGWLGCWRTRGGTEQTWIGGPEWPANAWGRLVTEANVHGEDHGNDVNAEDGRLQDESQGSAEGIYLI